MTKSRIREFTCSVVNEAVKINVRQRRSVGLERAQGYFVQCDQAECQYVMENKPPCPLDPGMFADEISEIEERKRRQREDRQ
jgi:hypothetical protein